MFQLFQRIAAESRLQNFIGVFVSLEIVGSGTLQPGSDLIEIVFAVQFTDNRGAEFIVQISVQQEVDCLLYRIKVRVKKTCQGRVILGTGFDIHSSHLDKIFLGKIFQNFRMGSIGIQFDRISHFVDLAYKGLQICTERGLSSGDADSFQNTGSLLQEI